MFSSKDLKEMATISGLGEKAIQRLLGGIRLEMARSVKRSGNDEIPERVEVKFEIGLRLARPELLIGLPREERLQLLGQLIREYRTSCPTLTAWVGRGDFNPEKIPEQITRPIALHASRTAGRLRAKALRKTGSIL